MTVSSEIILLLGTGWCLPLEELKILLIVIFKIFEDVCWIFLQFFVHVYSCVFSLILLVRSFVKCNVLYNVVCTIHFP